MAKSITEVLKNVTIRFQKIEKKFQLTLFIPEPV